MLSSVEGMNFDFVAMNLTGFTFYSIYCSYGYFVNPDQTGQVDLNDLLFAYHALAATLLTLSQVIFFPKKKNKIHGVTIFYLLLLWSFVIVYAVLTQVPPLLYRELRQSRWIPMWVWSR
jgi:cystinosin